MHASNQVGRRARRSTPLAIACLLALAGIVGLAPAAAFAHPKVWRQAEAFYLQLLNCSRTGGWVRLDGTCLKYGSGDYSSYRRPLTRHLGISRDVARPYAHVLIEVDGCGHYFDGSPAQRFDRAGYEGSARGENVACFWSGTIRKNMISAARMWQAEKRTQGPHWRQLKSRAFTTVGIGVWRDGNRTRLVVDLYRP